MYLLRARQFLLSLLLLARCAAVVSAEVSGSDSYMPLNSSTLWYLQPAGNHGSKNAWMEYCLPLGNGHLGAMVGGGVGHEVIQLNEKSLWEGSSTVFGDYLVYNKIKKKYGFFPWN